MRYRRMRYRHRERSCYFRPEWAVYPPPEQLAAIYCAVWPLMQVGQECPMSSSAVSYANQNRQRFLSELKDLLRIPSISTLPQHRDDVRRAAQFIADELTRIGIENVEI